MLDNRDALKLAFSECYKAWVGGRIADLEHCDLHPATSIFPEALQGLKARNQNWMPKFRLALASPRKVLFTVGAAHLLGDGGLLQLFAKENHPLVPLLPQVSEQGADARPASETHPGESGIRARIKPVNA
jgi:hypothetical protein